MMILSKATEQGADPSERQLLRRVASGDAAALWELWELHRADLYRLCVRWMNGRVEDAQDACSSTMLKIRELLPGEAADLTNPGGWLARVAFNVCMDLHRDRGRRARLEGSTLTPPAGLEPLAPLPTPEEEFLRQELSVCLRNAVDDLPTTLRQPLVLRFFDSLTHQDIAQRLSLNSGSVRKRIQYAREILARRLGARPAAPRRRDGPRA
jgi:RNA polymerase sigma factor (sigma-70 family)